MSLPDRCVLLEMAPAGLDPGRSGEDASSSSTSDVLVSSSPVIHQVLAQASQIAASKVGVLIEGETGTGKELLAHFIHASSPRAEGPYVRVNCAALSESLIESELFGHEKGAFTGAEDARPGRFERANRGTLLLDEIGEIPLRIQAKLLRVLEDERFERVGGTRGLHSDVRIIATTNKDLERAVATETFRRDLLYRLNAVHFQVPPLRQRPEDIPVLTQHFFQRFRKEAPNPLQRVAGRTLQIMTAYSWPGNVRQLRNAIHRACLLSAGPELRPEDLPPLSSPSTTLADVRGQTLAEMERHVILQTLRDVGGNKTAAAARLGVTTRTLLNKVNKYRSADAA